MIRKNNLKIPPRKNGAVNSKNWARNKLWHKSSGQGGQRERERQREGKMNVNNPETRRTTDFINSSPEYRPVVVYLRGIRAKNETAL